MASKEEHLHIGYFRHGEVALLLEPREFREEALKNGTIVDGPPNAQPPLDANTLKDLRAIFRKAGVPLLAAGAGAAPDPAITGADGRERRILPLQRADLQVLQTVNLQSWIPFPVEESNHRKLFRSMTDVAKAVEGVNKLIAAGQQKVGRYKLTAAGPNWLAMRFNC